MCNPRLRSQFIFYFGPGRSRNIKYIFLRLGKYSFDRKQDSLTRIQAYCSTNLRRGVIAIFDIEPFHRCLWSRPKCIVKRIPSALTVYFSQKWQLRQSCSQVTIYMAIRARKTIACIVLVYTRLGIVIYTGRSSNSPYDRGWSVISGRCVTCMEQSSTARHHVTFPSSL